MNKCIRKAILIASSVIVIVIAIIATFFIVKDIENKRKIESVIEVYSNNIIQKNDENTNEIVQTKIQDKLLQIDGETTVGVIKIDKIGYEGLVYEGTSLDTLAKGVGHFENSAYFDGNVCLANHNYINQWGKLYTLRENDIIEYVSFLGKRKYKVCTIKEIEETDWSMLQDTQDNRLTLITCVYNKPNLRLCVQAIEIN